MTVLTSLDGDDLRSIGIAANPWRGPDFHNDPKAQANEERILRRIARLADSWQTDAIPPEVLRERWQRIDEYSAEYGRPGAVTEMSLHLMVNINDDAEQARRESVTFLDQYYGAGAITSERLESWLTYGSPRDCIEHLKQFKDTGCQRVTFRLSTMGDPIAQLRRVTEEVLPYV